MKSCFELKNIKKIYIFCPENKVTGGTEALHQLRYYLEKIGKKAYIIYHDIDNNFVDNASIPDRYNKYFIENKNILNFNEIIDSEENCVITSEFATTLLWSFKRVKKVVWWLAVKFYDGGKLHFKNSIKHCIKLSIKNPQELFNFKKYHNPYPVEDVIHFCASEYAYQFVKNKLHQNPFRLIEPISKEFLEAGMNNGISFRKDKIAYNPAKPSKTMKKLLLENNFDFVPIINLEPEEIIELLREVKLYIDFGDFPGPERIPKEAVYNGANILVGKKNAAINDFDINIPEKYKVENFNDINYISRKIEIMLKEYNKNYHDFDIFREQIDSLEYNFIENLREIFF